MLRLMTVIDSQQRKFVHERKVRGEYNSAWTYGKIDNHFEDTVQEQPPGHYWKDL